MVKIRLSLVGKKNAPAYRIVVCDERVSRDGKNIEIIGHFNPSVNPPTFSYEKNRYEHWLSVGAQPTDAVEKLIAGKYKFKKYEPAKGETAEESEASEKDKSDKESLESNKMSNDKAQMSNLPAVLRTALQAGQTQNPKD